MAYIDLPTQVMVAITGAWLDPEKERPIIERYALLSPFLEQIAKVHAGLSVFQNKGKGKAPEVLALQEKTSELDERHDRLAKAIDAILYGLALVHGGDEKDNPYWRIAEELFPDGLRITKRSYFVEAGDAALREARLSDESKRVLEASAIRTVDGEWSLRALVNRWNAVAEELGTVEAEKVQLRAAHSVEGSRGSARRAWVKVVTLFAQALELETGLTEDERRAILLTLEEEDAKATKRRAAARKGEVFDPDVDEEQSGEVESRAAGDAAGDDGEEGETGGGGAGCG